MEYHIPTDQKDINIDNEFDILERIEEVESLIQTLTNQISLIKTNLNKDELLKNYIGYLNHKIRYLEKCNNSKDNQIKKLKRDSFLYYLKNPREKEKYLTEDGVVKINFNGKNTTFKVEEFLAMSDEELGEWKEFREIIACDNNIRKQRQADYE
jgi:predicted RNase H-like nuclease (RuvC/YqgF family)